MMKTRSLVIAAALCAGIAGTAMAATAASEHSHGHGAGAVKLQLDAGRKWGTDEPLRRSMGSIREAMAGSLRDIHGNRMSTQGYAALSKKVEGEVARIVAECKLEPKADEQLHLVLADVLEGVERMAGKAKGKSRRSGAEKVAGALEHYATYFDDPGFKPLPH